MTTLISHWFHRIIWIWLSFHHKVPIWPLILFDIKWIVAYKMMWSFQGSSLQFQLFDRVPNKMLVLNCRAEKFSLIQVSNELIFNHLLSFLSSITTCSSDIPSIARLLAAVDWQCTDSFTLNCILLHCTWWLMILCQALLFSQSRKQLCCMFHHMP